MRGAAQAPGVRGGQRTAAPESRPKPGAARPRRHRPPVSLASRLSVSPGLRVLLWAMHSVHLCADLHLHLLCDQFRASEPAERLIRAGEVRTVVCTGPAPSRRLTCALVLATHNDRRARRVLQTDRLLWSRDAGVVQAERGAWAGGLEVHADTVHSCHEFTRPTPCAASIVRAHHSQRHAADALPVRSEALPRRGGGFTPGEHRASACERCRCRGSPAATHAAPARETGGR